MSEPKPGPGSAGPHELTRAISHRQIQLMAIGGAIGVGLFLGSRPARGEAQEALTE